MTEHIKLTTFWFLQLFLSLLFVLGIILIVDYVLKNTGNVFDDECKASCEALNANFIDRTFDGCFCEKDNEQFRIK